MTCSLDVALAPRIESMSGRLFELGMTYPCFKVLCSMSRMNSSLFFVSHLVVSEFVVIDGT